MNVLVIDVGGSNVKMLATGALEPRRFPSGKDLTPDLLVDEVRQRTHDWEFDVISLGIPAVVDATGAVQDPGNLAKGWVRFDFESAFARPVRIVNDAVMQALGGYKGGRMLFLGLGTGLGSTLVSEHVVMPLELGRLPSGYGDNMWERLGRKGLDLHGRKQWVEAVHRITAMLRSAFVTDYIILGGGNAENVDPLPPGTHRGGNDDAFAGGFMLWEEVVEPHDQWPGRVWRVLR